MAEISFFYFCCRIAWLFIAEINFFDDFEQDRCIALVALYYGDKPVFLVLVTSCDHDQNNGRPANS